MKYHAIITIVDDKNNEITRMVKDEDNQIDLSRFNLILHDFHIGSLYIPEGREVCQLFEETKKVCQLIAETKGGTEEGKV